MDSKRFSQEVSVFQGRSIPEPGLIVGYAALIDAFSLAVPMPRQLSLISHRHRKYETEEWRVFPVSSKKEESLYKHLVFALKNEGIDLLFFKKLFLKVSEKEIQDLVSIEPNGQYSRRIWFLYEWLLDRKLDLPDLTKGNAVKLVDEKLQYALEKGERFSRYRIENNLPGTKEFCPLIFKSKQLEEFIAEDLEEQQQNSFFSIHKELLQRTSAFLLLKDSKASFSIEGENPTNNRARRWGEAIGQAGQKELSKEELLRLQQIVIKSTRFTKLGWRETAGFVGEHDRETGEPIPDHISARWEAVEELIGALLASYQQMKQGSYPPILTAACVSFGFVFIHPFVDGNGRVHRYLIHHILSEMELSKPSIIFPVSASILDKIVEYRKLLESYSHPILDFIEWKSTADHNVEVYNDTDDYYRYFDATSMAIFLFECVKDTIQNIIPKEVKYLRNYDEFKRFIDDSLEMPDKDVALLIKFLSQNEGSLSKRAIANEFIKLTKKEITSIEEKYKEIFLLDEY